MTGVVVNAGICGFTATIKISKIAKRKVDIKIISDCEMVIKLSESIPELDTRDVLKPGAASEVHHQASIHALHTACPVPVAILKAIEVEMGMALARDVMIHFETSERDRLPFKNPVKSK